MTSIIPRIVKPFRNPLVRAATLVVLVLTIFSVAILAQDKPRIESAILATYLLTVPAAALGGSFLIGALVRTWPSRHHNPSVWFMFAAAGGLSFFMLEEASWAIDRFSIAHGLSPTIHFMLENYVLVPLKIGAALFAFFHAVAGGYARVGLESRDIPSAMFATCLAFAVVYPLFAWLV